jgi:hypothetical protein
MLQKMRLEWSKDIQTQAPPESSLLTGPKKVAKMDTLVFQEGGTARF